MDVLAHSTEWLIILTNGLVAHVSISTIKVNNHEYHYIRTPKIWRSVYCKLKVRTHVG